MYHKTVTCCGTCYTAVAQAIVWNGRIVMNNELEMMWKEVVVDNLQAP
jgi:uncharacterized protein involved in tolerance to divalent cations